ncbi:MAG: cytochrome c oxidase subunit 3 [Parvularculaceae bacterium]
MSIDSVPTIHEDLFGFKHNEPDKIDIHGERALAFWFYLMSDAMIFAILFANFGILVHGTAGGPDMSEILNMPRVALQTALLLLSSLTFGLVTISALSKNRNVAIIWLCVTFALGAGFLILEIGEFSEMVAEGATPQVSGFLSAFYVLVGTHGLHMVFGLGMLTVMLIQFLTKGLTLPVLSRLYRVGLFWHFLDLIWVAIFSYVYLPGALN